MGNECSACQSVKDREGKFDKFSQDSTLAQSMKPISKKSSAILKQSSYFKPEELNDPKKVKKP
jgi:hypothetical protein